MDNKPEMKRIEDVTRCQVTFSKRRSSLLRKANEISVFCDVDVALVAFSPSGRVSKFCSRERIEDVLERYVKLAPDKRYQEYELENEEGASLAQILWCEKNLKATLQGITDRKRRGQAPSDNFPGNPVLNRARQNLNSRSRFLMQHNPRTWPYSPRVHNSLLDQRYQPKGISGGVPGASCSFAFNPLAASFPAIYQHPSYTQRTEIPPTYHQIQHQPFLWDPTAASIQNLQLGVYGNSSMHQAIIGNPALHCVPYQPLGTLGTSNLYQPMMPGILDQQLGVLGSSSVQQLMREDQITPVIPNQQLGALGDSFLDKSLMGVGTTPYAQFQQAGVLGSPSVGRLANVEPLGPQENPTPTSYHNYNNSNTQKDVSSLPSMFQLQVDPNEMNLHFLGSPSYNTTQNLVATPLLNSEKVSSEPVFTNNIGSITTPTHGDGDNANNGSSGGNSNSNNGNNGIDNCDTNEKHPACLTQENPPPESPTDSMFLNSLLNEEAIENDTSQPAGNQEDSFIDWDGFALAENLNLEDFEILF
ncbi:myocyte-specific enhancer factor 2A-like [Herrania umbratica]|uniref:Myocyte-specific enhancer factor 2A-like n=1 Tax=Herrania umbratica TaxID=108875 RepID=A0A6J0ZKR6_9ROSI|nr:myocyte-specific enhancer factor 2A-like [Herrania umbratica]